MNWTPANITEDLRQMGRDDFAQGQPQSYGLRCWGSNSLALKRWLEGWEQAELDAYCDMNGLGHCGAPDCFMFNLDEKCETTEL